MRKTVIALVIAAALVAGGYAIWTATKPKTGSDGTQGKSKGPVPVKTVAVVAEPMPILLDAVGAVEPDQSVSVRSEVTGTLQRVLFKEGDQVNAGQPLFQVDSKTFQADVDKARATVAKDQALFAEAMAQQRRLAPLVAKEYVTRQEYDQALAQQKSASATTESDRAVLRQAEVQLGRTLIRAPISGLTGNLNIKLGNLVTANGPDPLIVINSIQPVKVAFSIPEQQLSEIRQRMRAAGIQVEIRQSVNDPIVATGTLEFIDNAVDPATGTIKLKARVPNEKQTVWPGEMVSVRVILAVQPDAIVVPESAVQPGQNGPFVYVADQGKARMQPVVVARQVGPRVVVAKGVRPGQQVIVNIPQALKPGSAIKPLGAPPGEKGSDKGAGGHQRKRGAPPAGNPSAAGRP